MDFNNWKDWEDDSDEDMSNFDRFSEVRAHGDPRFASRRFPVAAFRVFNERVSCGSCWLLCKTIN